MQPIDLIRVFDAVAVPLLKCQQINDAECRVLSALRDTLLPKLNSGDLRVKGPERQALGVV